MKKDQIKAIQRALIAEGYPLPKYGVDGYVGSEFYHALGQWAYKNNHLPQGKQEEVKSTMTTKFKHSKRSQPIKKVVLHWTAGLGDAAQVERTLVARKYGIHYVVDPKGVVTQLAPHDVVVSHCGGANEDSIGIEIVGMGQATSPRQMKSLKWGVNFRTTSVVFLGKKRNIYVMPLVQLDAVASLVSEICKEEGIPKVMPPDVRMSKDAIASFSGVMGHYHAHATKLDPGPLVMSYVRESWNE